MGVGLPLDSLVWSVVQWLPAPGGVPCYVFLASLKLLMAGFQLSFHLEKAHRH